MVEYLLTLLSFLGSLPSLLMNLRYLEILEDVKGVLTNPLVLILILCVGGALLLRPRVT